MSLWEVPLRFVNSIYNGAWVTVILGAVLTLVGTLLLFWTGAIRDTQTSKQIADANNQAAQAHANAETARKEAASYAARIAESEAQSAEATARAAEANRKAEEEHLARVRIEQRLGPRWLSGEQQRSVVAATQAFAGKRFWVIAETDDRDPGSEQVRFAEQLSATLVHAGWVKEAYQSGWTITKAPLPLFRRVSSRDVEIGYGTGDADEAKIAQALAAALAGANIDTTTAAFSDLSGGIVINVGLR